jgi:hypothetical protein
MLLDKEEYVEQRFLFKTFLERLEDGYSSQEILYAMKSEVLSTVKLPLAIDYLLAEIKLRGTMAGAMAVMKHYFSPFQTFVVKESEKEGGRFDFKTALRILERLAGYLVENPTPQGVFFYQFETISRNRLGYDESLRAIADDPIYDAAWRRWINVILRRQIGSIDLASLIYVRSEFYRLRTEEEPEEAVLFGEREGRIGWASRGRDPSFLFSALNRHLGYPKVPRPIHSHEEENQIPMLKRRIGLLESRLTLLEEQLKGGINLERFYVKEQDK